MRIIRVIAIVMLTCGFVVPRDAMRNKDGMTRTGDYISIRHFSSGTSLGDSSELAQQFSSWCVTPRTSCQLPKPAPVGTDCWCATPNGPVAGKVQ
jgi:hypothetical protein